MNFLRLKILFHNFHLFLLVVKIILSIIIGIGCLLRFSEFI